MSASSDHYALSFDVGTTTIAASLVDKAAGRRIAAAGTENPQRSFGLDVTARLSAALADEGPRAAMSRLTGEVLERLAEELLSSSGISWEKVDEVVVAANTVVTHLLMGLPLKMLAFPPYRPAATGGIAGATATIHWVRDIPLYLFPLPGGYVGGDLVAYLYGFKALPDRTLFLDMGTNCEIALTSGATILATSAAAGPAFEAGNLACGMVAGPGAVTGVSLEGDRVRPTTIGTLPPAGICGSAALEIVSLLLREGILDRSGRLLEPEETSSILGNRIVTIGGETCFLIHRDARRMVFLSQNDIRQLQVAKAAIRAGIDVLLERAAMTDADLAGVFITGSFGVEVAADHLKRVGVLTEKMVEVTRFSPEGALAGAERRGAAGNGTGAGELASRIKVVPLSGTPSFERYFLDNMNFPL